jgi:hypothetical protein
MVDQKGSLGFLGDVFEVMAQVDRRLIKVNTVDQIIRVNYPAENLGRHNAPKIPGTLQLKLQRHTCSSSS